MSFILTPEIVDDILFAMENQAIESYFDTQSCRCVSSTTVHDCCRYDAVVDIDATADSDAIYVAIPCWTSADGFRLMEQFIASIKNAAIQIALRKVLKERKGVFRKFKHLLKTYPEVEKCWYQFKEYTMREAVYRWYNDLRLCWGLESMSFEAEEDAPLLYQDFLFSMQKGNTCDTALFSDFIMLTKQHEAESISAAEKAAAALLQSDFMQPFWQPLPDISRADCLTVYADKALCGLCVVIWEECAGVIAALRVHPKFRGLGIGKELLKKVLESAEQHGVLPLVFTDLYVPAYFITVLERSGFFRAGLLYVKQ